jgi:WD40 repeat protein
MDATARLWSLPDGGSRKTMNHPKMVWNTSFSADSGRFLTVGADNLARQFDVASGDEMKTVKLVGHEALITAGRYSPDGKRIATVSWDRTARLWDASTGQELARYTHDDPLHDVIFSPDGTALITVSEAAQVRYIPIDPQALLHLADERATRALTALECQVYLDLQSCPAR